MTDVERLLDQARHLPPEQRRRFMRQLAEFEQEETQGDVSALPGQVDGYWYRAIDEVPAAPPDYLPTGAVLPEGGPLGEAAVCLDLVQLDDGWFPLSASGVYTYSHSSELKYGRECYFLPRSDAALYRVELAGEIERAEVTQRFGLIAGERARSDRKTILLRLQRVDR